MSKNKYNFLMGIKIYVDMVGMVSTQDEMFLIKVSAKFLFDSINFQGVGTFLICFRRF